MKILCPACEGAKRIPKPENMESDKQFIKCPCCEGSGIQYVADHPPRPPVFLPQIHITEPQQSIERPRRFMNTEMYGACQQ